MGEIITYNWLFLDLIFTAFEPTTIMNENNSSGPLNKI